ncbi:MAG: PEP-CTERM sorting domain-containing protein [Bryobacteraceae bacterium]|jgi:hypothetical protein
MTTLRRILFGFTLAALATGAASANSIVLTEPSTPSGAYPVTATFATFNTTLGTLNDVIITLYDTSTATVDIENITSGSLPFTNATASIPITITGGGATDTDTAAASVASGTAVPGLNVFTGVTGNTSNATTVTGAGLSLWENPPASNTITLTITEGNGSYSGNGQQGSLFFGGAISATSQATVEYDYTPFSSTPEPASFALVGLALVGFGVARKRLKKS